MLPSIRAKKHLGQHFLKDLKAAQRIVDLLTLHDGYKKVLEIGPGMGVLTQFLLQRTQLTKAIEEWRKSTSA